jgi:hypothetical protein
VGLRCVILTSLSLLGATALYGYEHPPGNCEDRVGRAAIELGGQSEAQGIAFTGTTARIERSEPLHLRVADVEIRSGTRAPAG